MPTWHGSMEIAMSEILSREDAVRAFLDGKELELNYKGNKGGPASWVPLTDKGGFWFIIARQSSDFRLAVPKAAFEAGEVAYLVSYDDAKDGRRHWLAFSYHRGAMFVKVVEKCSYHADEALGWTYEVVDSTGVSQTVHERDLRKAAEVGPFWPTSNDNSVTQ